jgi:hypothetical protein
MSLNITAIATELGHYSSYIGNFDQALEKKMVNFSNGINTASWKPGKGAYCTRKGAHPILGRVAAIPVAVIRAVTETLFVVVDIVESLTRAIFNLIGAAFSKKCTLKAAGIHLLGGGLTALAGVVFVCALTVLRGVLGPVFNIHY